MTFPLESRTTTKYYACIGKKIGQTFDWSFEVIDSPTCLSLWESDGAHVVLGTEVTIYSSRRFYRTFYVGERPVVIHEGDYTPLKLNL